MENSITHQAYNVQDKQNELMKKKKKKGKKQLARYHVKRKVSENVERKKKEKKIWRIHWTFGLRCLCLFFSYRVSSMMS